MKVHGKIGGPSAWRRADFDDNHDWVETLSLAEIAEVHAAWEKVHARGLRHGAFAKHDFPLPILEQRLARVGHEIRKGRGFVLLRGLPVARYALDELKSIYWGFGCHMGTIIANNVAGDFVSAVTDLGALPPDANRRFNTTNQGMEPHTDPADIVVLLCVERAMAGGLSSLVSATAIHDELVERHPDYLPTLYRGFVRDVRGMGSTRDPNEVTETAVPVFERSGDRLSCSFSRTIIRHGAQKAGVELTSLEVQAIDAVHEAALRPDLRLDMMLEPGDIQIINNFALLHDRTAYVDYSLERKRYLLRMWINIPEGPQLSPAFAAAVRSGVPPRAEQ